MSWYFGTPRDDFTFRKEMFNGFNSASVSYRSTYKAEVNRAYKMKAIIGLTSAEYYIDDELYTKLDYNGEDVVP